MKTSADNVKGREPLSETSRWRGAHAPWLARGQAMVEMALILPIFLFFIFGIIEIGRAWSVKQVMTNAAREGSRVLLLPSGPGYAYADREAVRAAAKQAAEDYLHFAGLSQGTNVTISVDDVDLANAGPGNADPHNPGAQQGTTLHKGKVNITHDFDTPLPVILLKGSSPIRMGVTSVVEIE